jgi:hypothetical protein
VAFIVWEMLSKDQRSAATILGYAAAGECDCPSPCHAITQPPFEFSRISGSSVPWHGLKDEAASARLELGAGAGGVEGEGEGWRGV